MNELGLANPFYNSAATTITWVLVSVGRRRSSLLRPCQNTWGCIFLSNQRTEIAPICLQSGFVESLGRKPVIQVLLSAMHSTEGAALTSMST